MIKSKNIIRCRLNAGIEKVYPELEDVTLKATKESQTFKSETHYGYNKVILEPINLEDKIVTPTKEQIVIVSDTADGLNSVTVESIPDVYIKPTGTKEITENGKYNIGEFENVDVHISGGIEDYLETNIQLTRGTMDDYFKKIPPIDFSKYTDMSNYFMGMAYLEEARKIDCSSAKSLSQIYNQCNKLKIIYGFSNAIATNCQNMIRSCPLLETVENLIMDKCTQAGYMCYGDSKLKNLCECNLGACYYIPKILYNCSSLENFGGFKDLGKGYSSITTSNSSDACLDLSSCTKLTYESLMNVINKLYDLNLTYNVANGGTLYSQQLILGSTNLAKLTSDEIAIATNKGWVVS